MSNEPGAVVFAQPAGGSVSGKALFPREFQRRFYDRFDRRFTTLLLICMVVIFTAVGILSLRKPSATVSEKEISIIQERYARLVLNQPKPEIEEKLPEVTETVPEKTTTEKSKKKKEEVKVDREKETFVEKKKRKESGAEERRQRREEVSRQVQASGIFAAITASGSGVGGGAATTDLLGTAGLGVTDLGDLSLDKGTFAARDVSPEELVAKRGERTSGVKIEKESVGKTAVTRVASNVKVNVSTAPPEVSGESSSLQERSQAAIQKVVSRQSTRLKRLYEEWLKRDPALSGRLTVKFVILPSGAVANAGVVKSSTDNPDFDAMVLRYIKRWHFPEVSGAGPVEVVYPFVFEGLS
jgi:TonB family protein